MRVTRLGPVVFVLLFAGPSFAQGWINYVSEQDSFTINFPGEPAVQDITYPSEYSAVFPARVYSASRGENRFSVTVVDYSDSERIHLARTNTTEADDPARYDYWRIDVLASVAYAAQNFRLRGGDVTFDAWAHIDRVPGHQLQITNPDQSRTYAGIFLHVDQLYIVEATAPASAPPQGHFQQSLGFIDEDGNRIRYGYDADGHLIRDR